MLIRVLKFLDLAWMTIYGYVIDFEHLPGYSSKRQNFSTDFLVKERLSPLFFCDRKIKRTVARLGGWARLTSPHTLITEEEYAALADAGFPKHQVECTRNYLKDPAKYRKSAIDNLRIRQPNAGE